ncbi:DoxX family protein [Microbulbifer yueqingensis]|nr:hypothetical protein [Microbulbifer yueqingensis]
MTTPIIILILLTLPLLLAFCFSKARGGAVDTGKYAGWGLGIAFLFFSLGHFIKTAGMVEMLPAWVPMRLPIIYITGVLELAIGCALFFRRWRAPAAKVAIILLVVFFPANIYAALNGVGLGGHQWGPVYLLIRLPLQLVLILWAYCLCVKSQEEPGQKGLGKSPA